MVSFLRTIIGLYQLALIFAAVITWLGPEAANNPAARFLRTITEPVLRPIRRVIPLLGSLDVSPIVAALVLEFVAKLLVYLAG